MKKQPKPLKNNNPPIVDLVIKDMKDRKKLGLKRYGVALQANNGRDSLQDLYEELLDACIYIKQVLEEDRLMMKKIIKKLEKKTGKNFSIWINLKS